MHSAVPVVLVAVALTALAGCDAASDPARVIVKNDTSTAQHVFYCAAADCAVGLGGNDVVLQPGQTYRGYFNSDGATGPIGVATSPGNLLLGCLDDPSAGVAAPPTVTLLTSRVRNCSKTAAATIVTMRNP